MNKKQTRKEDKTKSIAVNYLLPVVLTLAVFVAPESLAQSDVEPLSAAYDKLQFLMGGTTAKFITAGAMFIAAVSGILGLSRTMIFSSLGVALLFSSAIPFVNWIFS